MSWVFDHSLEPLANVLVAPRVADQPEYASVEKKLHFVVLAAECSASLGISVGSQSGSSPTGSVFQRVSISFTRRARSARSAAASALASGAGFGDWVTKEIYVG